MNALLNHVWGKSPAADRVWAQVTGLAPSRVAGRLLMSVSFQAFIDESVSRHEFVLAGHIATPEQWALFSKEWEEMLPMGTIASNGKYHFKMSEMTSPERMQRVPHFYRLIERHVITSVSCRVNMEDFARARERNAEMASRLNISIKLGRWENPYYVTFRLLLDHFHKNREKFKSKLPLDQKIDFIFDDRSEKSFILAAWDEIMEKKEPQERELFGATPRFEDDQDFLPLQGADLWAWWVREWYEEDADPMPDKMKKFDFGEWQGKKRPNAALSASEDSLFDLFQATMMELFAEGAWNRMSADGTVVRGSD